MFYMLEVEFQPMSLIYNPAPIITLRFLNIMVVVEKLIYDQDTLLKPKRLENDQPHRSLMLIFQTLELLQWALNSREEMGLHVWS